MTTTVATTARRIAKTLNTHTGSSINWKVIFDADGHQLDAHQADMWYADPKNVIRGEHVFVGGNRRRFTARQVQEAIDRRAAEEELMADATLEDPFWDDL